MPNLIPEDSLHYVWLFSQRSHWIVPCREMAFGASCSDAGDVNTRSTGDPQERPYNGEAWDDGEPVRSQHGHPNELLVHRTSLPPKRHPITTANQRRGIKMFRNRALCELQLSKTLSRIVAAARPLDGERQSPTRHLDLSCRRRLNNSIEV